MTLSMLPRFCENEVINCVLPPAAYFSPSLYYEFLEQDKKKSLIRQSEHEVLRKSGLISIQLSSAAVGRSHRDALSGGVSATGTRSTLHISFTEGSNARADL